MHRMNCEHIPVALLRAADGELEAGELAAVEAHVKECASCCAAQEVFWQADRDLSACGKALDQKNSMPVPALRRPRVWVLVSLAGVALVALTLWVPRSRPPALSTGWDRDDIQTIRVELPLSAVGDPFLNNSESEPPVHADVVVGADGLPQDVRLAF